MSDFFKTSDEPETPEKVEEGQPEAPSKVKLGEKEYTQEELSKLVGLGEMATDLETKWNTKIDRLYPEYTRATQKLRDAEEEKKKAELEAAQKKAQQGKELSEDEAKAQLEELVKTLGFVKNDDLERYYANRRAAERLLDDVNDLIVEAKEAGKPATTADKLLQHMEDTGIKNPEKAYKDLFESELEQWKEEQKKRIKPSGLVTQSASTAGGKLPAPVKVTRDNLGQLLSETINRGI